MIYFLLHQPEAMGTYPNHKCNSPDVNKTCQTFIQVLAQINCLIFPKLTGRKLTHLCGTSKLNVGQYFNIHILQFEIIYEYLQLAYEILLIVISHDCHSIIITPVFNFEYIWVKFDIWNILVNVDLEEIYILFSNIYPSFSYIHIYCQ